MKNVLLMVIHKKRLDYAYIDLSDVKEIVDFKTRKIQYVCIQKQEYERLKECERILDDNANKTLF